MSRRPRAVDVAIVVVIAGGWLVLANPSADHPAVLGTLFTVAQLPILLRRRAPWTALLLGVLACLPVLAAGGPVNGLGLAVLLHTAVHRGRPPGRPRTAVALACGGTALTVACTVAAGIVVGSPSPAPAAAVLVGAASGLVRRVAERLRHDRRERAEAAALAATLAADRQRIGGELHEEVRERLVAIVGHTDRVAGGCDARVTALAAVESDARAALTALRRMLVLLRDSTGAPVVGSEDGPGTGVRGPRWPDVALTAAFAVAAALLAQVPFPGAPSYLGLPSSVVGWVSLAVAIGALLLRTAAPSVAYLLNAAAVAATAAPGQGGVLVTAVAGCVLIVSALARDPLRRSVPAVVVGTAVATAALLVALGPAYEPGVYATLLWGTLASAALAGWGLWLRARRLRRGRERADRAERSRREQRLRIARDLHDVVAHHVSGMVVQAGTAHALAGSRPDLVDGALAHARDAGGRTLTAMPGLLDALDVDADPPPTLTVDDVELLAGPLRAAGATVRVRVDGDAAGAAAREARQIVREALTNVLRHAGPTATDVRVGLGPGAMEVTVTDAGPVDGHRAEPGGGFGLVGVRERVSRLGGRLDAGPDGDGWRVRAVLPRPA